jgi:hypothetical protein
VGLAVVIGAALIYANYKRPTGLESDAPIDRMVDTRDPKTIAGSVWTAHLDCTYKNPPASRTARVRAFDCATTTHNVELLSSGRDYFIPRSTADDGPPYCLVKGSVDTAALQMARERQRVYCMKEWPWWKRMFF